NGRVVEIVRGVSVLEASRMAGIPHASVCGGRGRCSTCRIRVAGPKEAVLPPAPEEAKVLRRVGAAPDVRLACQLRPHGDLRVTPLLPATAQARERSERSEALNRALINDLPEPLRIGIGIHTGPAIVGEMGYGTAVSITAVGDSVNTASRVEGLTKTYACELVISEAVALRAGV